MAAGSSTSAYPLQLLADFNNGILRTPSSAAPSHSQAQPQQHQHQPTTNPSSHSHHATPAFNPSPAAAALNAAVTITNSATPAGVSKDPWLENRIAKTRAAKPLFPGGAPLPPGKSPLEPWRAFIEERTKNGESCEQIAAALLAQGVQTSDKSVSRYRIMWGFRRRAQRKQSKPPKPASERKKAYNDAETQKRRAAITHMTQQGLTAEEIAQVMVKRGMVLNKGASTIFRLQSRWGLREMPLKDRRSVARVKARRQQEQEFRAYAKELGVAAEKLDEWLREKLNGETAVSARQEIIKGLLGDEYREPMTGKYARKDRDGNSIPPATRQKRSTKKPEGATSANSTPATAAKKTPAKRTPKGKGEAVAAPDEMDIDTDAEVEAQLEEESSRVLRPRASDARPVDVSSDSDFDSDGASNYAPDMAMDDGGDNHSDADADDFAPTMDPGAPPPTWSGPPSPGTAAPTQRTTTAASARTKHTSATFSLAPLPAPKQISPIQFGDSFVEAARKLRDVTDAYVQVATDGIPGAQFPARDINAARVAMREALAAMMTRFPEMR